MTVNVLYCGDCDTIPELTESNDFLAAQSLVRIQSPCGEHVSVVDGISEIIHRFQSYGGSDNALRKDIPGLTGCLDPERSPGRFSDVALEYMERFADILREWELPCFHGHSQWWCYEI